jgi:hypothetical protein
MHTTTPPTQQGPSSNRPLTIDTNRLRDLWLPAENRERQAGEYLEKLCLANKSAKQRALLCTAIACLSLEYVKTIKNITERGGLLLIGGAA